jgi:hypothetical protein
MTAFRFSVQTCLCAVAIAGCGRIGFDGLTDGNNVPIDAVRDAAAIDSKLELNHDEDSDGLPDVSDNCPFIANLDQLDFNADGVGNACDRIAAGPDKIIFHPLTMGDRPFSAQPASCNLGLDSWHCSGVGETTLEIPQPVTNADVWIGFEVAALQGPAHRIAILADDDIVSPVFYSEMDGDAAGANGNIVRTNGGTDTTLVSALIPTFPLGLQQFHLSMATTPSPLFKQQLNIAGVVDIETATTGYVGSSKVKILFVGVDVTLRYVAFVVPQ